MDGPETTLSLTTIAGWLLDLLETLIQRQIVPHGVLPTSWRSREVGEVPAT